MWRRVGELIAEYFQDPETVAHTEYYPNNILVVDGEIHPVDWESAAVAPGELDLASLLDGWPPEVADRCTAIYQDSRWSGACPDQHGPRLKAARAYLHCRWLAREADKGRLSASNARFRRLRELDGELARVC
jgi:thiamine kinase-like enzyme